MTSEQETVYMIRGMITELPADQQEACNEVADHLRRVIESAGEPAGTLALALVGAEMQIKAQ